ncbi:hypothetical protein KIKIMORA_01220 [Brevundimonas phage vB_BpoS-Kikimora]|uniref:Uncharacterized protein n=1 Tax=Brevundimonas phage vB_BpoS-Kikimora TaxID=2948601 RepID=A0A9E7MRW5_9CAUD|nr:hypothetical protein KIKIMORA_01220 [Brevundimonas phage vB_BpoS-Kikimora]
MTDAPAHDWFNSFARIENLIHIQGALAAGDSFPDIFKEEFCYNLPENDDALLYKQCAALQRFADGADYPDAEDVAEALMMARVKGFFVQAAQPVVREFWDNGGYPYTWGHYHCEWLYAATPQDIDTVVAAWSDAMLQRDREKAAA